MTSPFWEKFKEVKFQNVCNETFKNNKKFMSKENLGKFRTYWNKLYNSDFYYYIEKRLKSFLWSSLMMVVAGCIDIVLESFTELNLQKEYVVILGLVLSQVSKFLNNKYGLKK